MRGKNGYTFQVRTRDESFREALERYYDLGYRSRSEMLVHAVLYFVKTQEERRTGIEDIVYRYTQTEEFKSQVLRIVREGQDNERKIQESSFPETNDTPFN